MWAAFRRCLSSPIEACNLTVSNTIPRIRYCVLSTFGAKFNVQSASGRSVFETSLDLSFAASERLGTCYAPCQSVGTRTMTTAAVRISWQLRRNEGAPPAFEIQLRRASLMTPGEGVNVSLILLVLQSEAQKSISFQNTEFSVLSEPTLELSLFSSLR